MKLSPIKPKLINTHYFIQSLIIILISLFLVSCEAKKEKQEILVMKDSLLYEINSDKPYSGLHKGKVNNSFIEYEVFNGVKQGTFKISYEDGTLQMNGTMDRNKNVGKWQYFYKDGSLESEGNFADDFPEGQWTWYYKNGNKKEEGTFKRGIRVGEWRFYNEEGNQDSSGFFELKDSVSSLLDSLKQIN